MQKQRLIALTAASLSLLSMALVAVFQAGRADSAVAIGNDDVEQSWKVSTRPASPGIDTNTVTERNTSQKAHRSDYRAEKSISRVEIQSPDDTGDDHASATARTSRSAALSTYSPPVLVQIPQTKMTDQGSGFDLEPLPTLARVPSIPRGYDAVYLTFDDGPDPVYTNQILDVLSKYGATATFFVVGESVEAHPETARRIIAEGHAIGSHTYGHEALPLYDDLQISQTLNAAGDAIARVTGSRVSCMRPPYGSLDQRTLETIRSHGLSIVMWDVDSKDWRSDDPYSIASRVLAETKLGSRVLMHDGPSGRWRTAQALESVLGALTAKGVRFAQVPGC